MLAQALRGRSAQHWYTPAVSIPEMSLTRSGGAPVAAVGAAGLAACAVGSAFTIFGPSGTVSRPVAGNSATVQRIAAQDAAGSLSQAAAFGAALSAAACLGVALRTRSQGAAAARAAKVVALRAAGDENEVDLEAMGKQAMSGAAAAAVMAGTVLPSPVEAYPIFAQQNYKEPNDPSGKIACANCHLARRLIDVRVPNAVLPDTIFKINIDLPLAYDKRTQPTASGEKGPINVGAIAIMPEKFRLAPKDRLPKSIKKEMKGLSWAPWSKEKPNVLVVGPVPGKTYNQMVLPVLVPPVEKGKPYYYHKEIFAFGGNRGRGQVYPEGNQSNNNQFFAEATGEITAIENNKVTITRKDGTTETKDCMAGADLVVALGENVQEGDPLTTNPNGGGYGSDEKLIMVQDMQLVFNLMTFAFTIFLAQLTFVLKKKQFEKVQLAEGF